MASEATSTVPTTTVMAPMASRLQPFQCSICSSRFTRHENLKRHAAVHARSEASIPCDFCQTTFSRRDLRFRHMKRKHPDQLEQRTSNGRQDNRAASQNPRDGSTLPETMLSVVPLDVPSLLQPQTSISEIQGDIGDWIGSLDQDRPDHRFSSRTSMGTLTTMYTTNQEIAPSHRRGLMQRPQASTFQHTETATQDLQARVYEQGLLSGSFNHNQIQTDAQSVSVAASNDTLSSYLPDGLSAKDISYLQDDWFPSATQSARGYQLYFDHVSQFVPFLHRPTFDATETACSLGLSMLCLAFQHGEDPDCEKAGSGAKLSQRCFHRARVVAASEEERASDLTDTITLVQTYWLLQVYVMMYRCGTDSMYGSKMHSRMIALTRSGGLTQPIPGASTLTEDLDDLWREFIKAESQKRTLLAVHQQDALWYQLFSIPRSLSHLEIKHELPCREDCWTAVSSTLWAHRQLAARQSAPLVPYSDVVRIILSPNPDMESLPPFDIYGAINIAQFLLSSAREVSGWSTITGRLSLERFEPLRSSLLALEHLIRPHAQSANSAHAMACEATWEIAMLELLVWSPSHTSGIVGGSVDEFLTKSTILALSCQSMQGVLSTKDAIQPHIDWFLRYLNITPRVVVEPPWLVLYAYKAFLIAWQLMREGLSGAMYVVGVVDGDVHGAITWARKAFRRKDQQQLSKLITSCLDLLEG